MSDTSATVPSQALRRLQVKYIGKLAQTRTLVVPLVQRVIARTADEDDFTELRDHAHKLAGTGASFGFGDLTHAGRELDSRLRQVSPPDEQARLLARGLLLAIDTALQSEGSWA